MRRSVLSLIALVFTAILSISYAEEPRPFGLILGKTTKEEAIEILQKEGGRITKSGYKIVKGDIVNKDVEGVEFKGLPVDNLIKATLWFYKGVLYEVEYQFPLSMSKEEFDVVYKKLQAKYGKPVIYVRPYLADGRAVWRFKDVEVELLAPWASWSMYLTYTHIPLFNKVKISDRQVLEEETRKPQKGF